MELRNHASIAYALVSLASSVDDEPAYGSVVPGVLSRAPNDGSQNVIRGIAESLGMELVQVRTPNIEYHPGAIDCVSAAIEVAVASERPVLLLLDEAHGAQAGVLRALSSSFAKRVEDKPGILLAITTSAGEARVAEQIANGLKLDIGRVSTYRTADENLRLVERALEAMG